MARDHQPGLQGFDQVQRAALGFKAGCVVRRQGVQGRKDHAKAVLPQGIGRDQHALAFAPEHDHVGIVPVSGQHGPVVSAQSYLAAHHQRVVKGKTLALLPGGAVAQGVIVPMRDGLLQARWDGGVHLAVAALQGGIAARVVRVQVGVDNAAQRARVQGIIQQGQGLVDVGEVTRVDHGRGLTLGEDHLVGRQPAALQHPQAARQGHGVGSAHAGPSRSGTPRGIRQAVLRPPWRVSTSCQPDRPRH